MYSLAALSQNIVRTGNLRTDTATFLARYDHAETAGHCSRVAAEAKRLANRFHANADAAQTGGLLHDISVIIPNDQRIAAARAWSVDVLPAEETFPMIVHQKLSSVIARELFGVTDEAILAAVGCHTTLRASATLLDKVLFLADKIEWDQPGKPPYLDDLQAALFRSLDAACYCYLDYLWQSRHALKVIHPWTVIAHSELAATLDLLPKVWTVRQSESCTQNSQLLTLSTKEPSA